MKKYIYEEKKSHYLLSLKSFFLRLDTKKNPCHAALFHSKKVNVMLQKENKKPYDRYMCEEQTGYIKGKSCLIDVVIIHFHCTEKSRMNILQNITFSVT